MQQITVRFVAMEIHQIPHLRGPIMVIAFSGWNDAGGAATGALDHLTKSWSGETNSHLLQLIADIESEDFYDFQVNRPLVTTDETGSRKITWPTTRIFGLATPDYEYDFVIVKGVEPSMRWQSFTGELLDLADDLEVSMIITLGSLLADIPHSRPIEVNLTANSQSIAESLRVDVSSYEGPTGILGVIQEGCMRRGIDAISIWVPVPHYASNDPSPKSTLALINALEDYLSIPIPQDDLAAAADLWEIEVNNLAAEDSDVADYIKSLEESRDAIDIPDVSGDMIAKEFERYLRRKRTD